MQTVNKPIETITPLYGVSTCKFMKGNLRENSNRKLPHRLVNLAERRRKAAKYAVEILKLANLI